MDNKEKKTEQMGAAVIATLPKPEPEQEAIPQPTRIDTAEKRIADLEGKLVTALTELGVVRNALLAVIGSGATIQAPKPAQRAGRNHTPKQVKDTKTGKVYRTLGECGNDLAVEFGFTPNNWVWYTVKQTADAKYPGRLQVLG